MLETVWQGLQSTMSFWNLIALTFGTIIGIVVGIIPGIGPMVGMVILLPFTFSMPPGIALSLLIGIYCGGYFGGAVPAVLMRTPGVPSSIVTSFDGYPLTQKGEAQLGLSATIVGSFSGGIISVIILMLLAPLLAKIAANFGPPEYCMVAILGLIVVIMAYRKNIAQGFLLTALGLWFSTVGIDPGTLVPRFSFGTVSMQNGLNIAPMCLGFFGIGQTLLILERKILQTDTIHLTRSTLDFSKLLVAFKYKLTILKSGIIGTLVGLLPGTGSILASFLAYTEAKRSSKHPEEFGKGTPEGCIASEAGNNAVPAGALIPLLTLGIPGDALTAILLGVFTINGIYPGPLLLVKEPVLINTIYFTMFLINIVALILLALFLRPFAMIVKFPSTILAVSVMVVSALGIYSLNLQIFEIGVAIFMGILGYIMLRLEWPIVTWVIGFVLGPIIEERLRESLSLASGNPLIFLERPISLGFIIASLLIIILPIILDKRKKKSKKLFS
ncbi:MAG: tripartite tricarboxylate transporter permease [Deltaproteobacteria bacterium]|nr:tripartite tricarboxylate transporter permease [Deltaproteobacteria bacterium]